MLSCTIGELVGFGGIPVLGGAVAVLLAAGKQAVSRATVFYAVAVIGGLAEGAVLAWFQRRALDSYPPRLQSRQWIVATVATGSRLCRG